MLVSHMLYRTAQSSKVHRTESVSVMGHELIMGVSSIGSLAVSHPGAWYYKVTTCSRTEVTTIG